MMISTPRRDRRFSRAHSGSIVGRIATGVALAGLAIAPAVSACGFVAQGPPATITPRPSFKATSPDYQLGVSDKIRIIVFNEPTLSGEFTVNPHGAISAPLVGDVPAIGRTTGEVAANLEDRLRGRYLRNPHVSIDVLTFRPFYILGEVVKPGEYPFSAGLTVLDAVATAEGFTRRANRRRVFIKHAGSSTEAVEPLTSGLPVVPGDTIRFGERYF